MSASLPNFGDEEVEDEGHSHGDVVLRVAGSETLQKDESHAKRQVAHVDREVSKKRSLEMAQLDNEARGNDNDTNEINSEMQGIEDAELRAQIEAQLLSAVPIDDEGLTALHRAAESGLGEGVVARLLAACPALIDVVSKCRRVTAPVNNPAAGYAKRTALHCAARNGHAAIVAQLLAGNPASIEASTNEGFTALHCAARGGHAAIVTQLLAVKPALIEARANDGWTALHSAASAGAAAIVTQLLAMKPDLIDAKAGDGETALHCAAFYGHAEIVTQLLAVRPALTEARANDCCTYWHNAQDGHAAIVAELINMNPALADGQENFGWTALHWAAQRGHAAIVTQLLAANPGLVDARATNGETAFHCAARGGHAAIMTHLMSVSPASIEARLNAGGGETAHLEEAKGDSNDSSEMEGIDDDDDKEMLRQQIKAQLLSAIPIPEGRAALSQAARKGLGGVVARLLTACPALLDTAEWEDTTPLHHAALKGHTAIVTQLMDVNPALAQARAAYSNCTALHNAARYGHAATVAQLLAVNPTLIDARIDDGQTVLHFAAVGGHAVVSILLAAKPALIEARSNCGETVLHSAVLGGDAATVAKILASMNPALIEARTSGGRTVLHDAIQHGKAGTVAQLLAAHPALLDAIINDADALLNVVQIGDEEAVSRLLAMDRPNLIQQSSSDCGWTAFHFTAFCGHGKIMSRLLAAVGQPDLEQLLLRKSTESTDCARQGSTALHVAASKGHNDIVAQLLAACPALIDVVDDDNQTCLHCARAQQSTVELLLAFKPALVHAVDAYDNTILHLMLSQDNLTVGSEVLQRVWKMNPAALHAVNCYGFTPFELAVGVRNYIAIDSLQWKVTLDEIMRAFNNKRANYYLVRLKPLLKLQCEGLSAVLLPDVVDMVFEYVGLESPRKACLDDEGSP